ncbi:hypothetical protein ACFFWD_43090 [Bradyrhizobium erythrophlei]|uniref:hypothetical protein n=1 Tax=Bradyrhizobium erythrophlei TaxID=1437360 RepID=UPI0035E7E12A
MIQNRAHAEFNSVFMLCPNIGPVYLSPSSRHPIEIAGGNIHIVDYRGNIVSYSASAGRPRWRWCDARHSFGTPRTV